MQHPLEPKEHDAINYDTDGRCFRMRIEGDVLRLYVAAYLTILGKLQGMSVPVIVAGIICYVLSSVLKMVSPTDTLVFFWVVFGVLFSWLLLVTILPSRYAIRWDFDRARNVLLINKRKIAPLSDIAGIVGFKQGKHRFLLTVDFKNGKRKIIGSYFSTKEFSWREDARKIAEFLNVPLYIPDVYEV